MPIPKRFSTLKRVIRYGLAFLVFIFLFFFVLVNRYLEPVLKDRIHTLIIKGSDSLYQYNLGKLQASFFGGSVEVENLHIWVDSNRYAILKKEKKLPALTLNLNLIKGQIKGIGILSLVFGKRIIVSEIVSKDADVNLSRHIQTEEEKEKKEAVPLWKALQPAIKSINVGKINLDGIKLLYTNEDTMVALKLQFDRCIALFKDIQIDSASSTDTARIGFTKSVSMQFDKLKFRTADSIYKMKANYIRYSSTERTLTIQQFKLQPTLKGDDFYKNMGKQISMYTVTFDTVQFTGFRLDRFLHNNEIKADSVIFKRPDIVIYNDRTWPDEFESKIGKSPQQQLLKANPVIIVKGIALHNAHLSYTEKDDKTHQEGALELNNLNVAVSNITNSGMLIKKDPVCVAKVTGAILGNSPLEATFHFYLDSLDGKFDVNGSVKNITASQLNNLSVPLANVRMTTLNMRQLYFNIRGDEFSATSNIKMLYNNLSIALQKTNEATGEVKTKKFVSNIINKYTIWPDNPGSNGVERSATNVMIARVPTKSFIGLVWQAIFAGMEDVMLKTGS